MNPTTLDRAAHVVLAGILDAVPRLSADQLDELLLRVSWIHRKRVAGKDVAPEEIDAAVAAVGERMHSAAVHVEES